MVPTEAARPFHKAVGGKTQLLWRLSELAPKTIASYHECFLGGGALFFHLSNQGRFRRAVLTDKNEDLVRTWLAVQRNYQGVLRELEGHRHTEAHYYKVRARKPAKLTDEACAARFLFLVKSGFNGLWRENRSGAHNVPFGRQPKMTMFCDPALLKACSRALNARPVTIIHGDFEDTTRRVRLGDFVLSDSPYAPPASKSSAFHAYVAGGFGDDDQARLAAWFRRLDDRGVSALLCNSNAPRIEQLYSGMTIERIAAKRAINSDPTKRGDVKELLVSTHALAAMNAARDAAAKKTA